MSEETILVIEQVGVKLGFKKILSNISFRPEKGSVWGIIGPNGSGKTTLFRIVLGFLKADKGLVSLHGNGNADEYRSKMGIALDDSSFDPYMTGKGNLMVTANLRNLGYDTDLLPLVKRFQMEDAMDKRVKNYSYGMKKRLGLIAAFAGKPEFLLLDEPTNGLDITAQATLREEVTKFALSGGTVLMSSHTMTDVERICSHVALLHKGILLSAGTLEEVSKGHNNLEEAFLYKINNEYQPDL